MKSSESINELATALAAAQGQMGAAVKDAENPFFKSKYADLGAVIKALKEPFSSNGLSYTQFPIRDGDSAGVVTRLMHSSGQWMESEYTLPLAKFDAQSAGSAFTYARRYALQSIAGIPAADDDGNAATEAAPDPLEAHNTALQANLDSVNAIKDGIANGQWDVVAECWAEISDDDKKALWVAPSKGGIFTTAERAALKSDEFNAARKAMYGDAA